MYDINDMAPLKVELPEDILKAKWCGDFERAQRLIAMYLKNDKAPECVKARLKIETEIIKSLPLDYVYTEEEALKMLQEKIPGFTETEFQQLIDTSAVDWIYINGKLHACRKFLDTLLKVHPDLAARAGESDGDESDERKLLNQNCDDMIKNGKAQWHIRLRAHIKVAESAFRKGEKVKVHLPIPAYAINMKNIKILSTSPEAVKIGAPHQKQRTVYFECVQQENAPFVVEYEYDSVTNYVHPEADKVTQNQPDFDTAEQAPHIMFTPFIRQLCAELKGKESNPVIVARKFYDYCTTKVTYSYMREYFSITQIPEYCGLNLKGDCGVQALLFITLCRCAGIPAKWQSGMFVTPYSCGSHDWAQFYVEPYGWMFCDPSFGGSAFRSGNEIRHEYYFGNLDPFRMVANSEFQAPLIPPKKYLRNDPYDNQTGEMEYENHELLWNEVEHDVEIIECKKVQ